MHSFKSFETKEDLDRGRAKCNEGNGMWEGMMG